MPDPMDPTSYPDVNAHGGMAPQQRPQGGLSGFGQKAMGALGRVDWYGAYLAGKGEHGAAEAHARSRQEAMQYREEQARKNAMMEELQDVDPDTAEGSAEAFRIALSYGDAQLANAIAARSARAQEPLMKITQGAADDPSMRTEGVYDPNKGEMVFTGGAYKPSDGITIGGSGLDPNQFIGAEDRLSAAHTSERKPLQDQMAFIDTMEAVYGALEPGKDPTQAEAMAIVRSALRATSPEAINEQDVVNLVGNSFENIARRKMGLPIKVDRKQIDDIVRTAREAAKANRAKLAEIDARYGSVAGRRGFSKDRPPTSAPASGGARVLTAEEARALGLPD